MRPDTVIPRGVFFDLYGTLLPYGDMEAAWADWLVALHAGLTAEGLAISREALADALDGFFGLPEPPDAGDGLTVYERRLRRLCAELGMADVTATAIRRAADASIESWDDHVTLDPQALPVLEALRPTKALAMISNYDHHTYAYRLLARLGLAPLFEAIVISGEVGVKKPDPRIFGPALEATGLQPEEVVFVGDAPEDVAGARAAGIRPVLIRRDDGTRTAIASDYTRERPAAAPPAKDDVTVIGALEEVLDLVS